MAHAWPALALELGDAFDARFDAFARDAGRARAPATRSRDGLRSRARLGADGAPLGDDARVELLLARAALRRRGPFVARRAAAPAVPAAARRRAAAVASGRVHRSVAWRRARGRR